MQPLQAGPPLQAGYQRSTVTSHYGDLFSQSHELQSDSQLSLLTSSEVSQISDIISGYKHPKYCYSCDKNVLGTLNKLPHELLEKLKVVIQTHEGCSGINYFKKAYSFHTFILSKMEDGIMVFDPAIPEDTKMNSKKWIRQAFKDAYNDSMKVAFTNEYTLRFLHQFRIMDGPAFIEHHDTACDHYSLNPVWAGEMRNRILDSQFWKQSSRVNLYEFIQFCTESSSYGDIVSHCGDLLDPKDRLKDDEIAFIRQFYENI